MEFFSREYKVNWMGKSKYFLLLSAVLLLMGAASWWQEGGLRYGIDFKGGTLVYVRFAKPPAIDQIRQGLIGQGLRESVIQRIADIARADANEVVIGVEQQGTAEQALDAGKAAILAALEKMTARPEGSLSDLNSATSAALGEYLARRDPLHLGATSGEQYTQLARSITRYRDSERSGLVTSFEELKKAEGVPDGVVAALREGYYLREFAIRNVEIVGPKVGGQLRRQAILATLYALGGMLVYIAFRFEWVYGAAAVLAVFHDVLITLGFFSLFGYEISLTVIAALLTLVGYTMNDKIVIFDRIRENLRLMRRDQMEVIANRSINQTLSRTFLTGGLTFVSLIVLFLLGGDVLRSFSFALVVGIMVGTYSSFGIAAPMVVAWSHWRGQRAPTGSGPMPGGRSRQEAGVDRRVAAAGRR